MFLFILLLLEQVQAVTKFSANGFARPLIPAPFPA